MVFRSLQNFLLEDVGALQWKLQPPLEGEEKDEVDMKEMLSEIASFAQRIEDLAIEVNLKNYTSFFWFLLDLFIFTESRLFRCSGYVFYEGFPS